MNTLATRAKPIAATALLVTALSIIALVVLNVVDDGEPARGPWGVLAALGLVVSLGSLLGLAVIIQQARTRGTAVPAALAQRGWVAQPDPGVAQRVLNDFTFDEIHGMSENPSTTPSLVTMGPLPAANPAGRKIRFRGVGEVMTRVDAGWTFLSYRNDYVYNDGRIPGSHLPAEPEYYGMKVMLRNAGVIAAQAGAVFPYLHLAPHAALYRHSLDIGVPGFANRWHIDAERQDPEYARAMLTPQVVAVVMSEQARQAGHLVIHRGHVLSIVPIEQHRPETIDARLWVVMQLAAALPQAVARTHAYAHVDPSTPQWVQPRAPQRPTPAPAQPMAQPAAPLSRPVEPSA